MGVDDTKEIGTSGIVAYVNFVVRFVYNESAKDAAVDVEEKEMCPDGRTREEDSIIGGIGVERVGCLNVISDGGGFTCCMDNDGAGNGGIVRRAKASDGKNVIGVGVEACSSIGVGGKGLPGASIETDNDVV